MKKTLGSGFLLLLIAILCMLQVGAERGELHWYFIKNKAHRQPTLAKEFEFIKDYNAVYIDKAHGDGASDKVVYLTFDVGYENGNVRRVLDALDAEGVKGAFFVLKHFVTANQELVLDMVAGGHTVGNHTAHHPNLSLAGKEKIKKELDELAECYYALTEKELPRYFRPPEGAFSRSLLETVNELGYKTVFWSFAYADWDNNNQPREDLAIRTVLDNVHNGAVILLHATSETNATILPYLIKTLKGEGYRFGTLDELCGVL